MGPIELLIFALISLLLYGAIVSFSPTLFLTELAILTRSKRPLIHTIAFMTGISIPIILYITLAVVITDAGNNFTIPNTREVIGSLPIVSIIAGILLFSSGLRLKTDRGVENESEEVTKESPERLFRTKTLFWFGLIKMGTSLSSIAAILLGVSFIKSFVTRGVFQAVALIWFVVISLLPFLSIAGLKRYAPKIFARLQRSSDRITDFNWLKVLRWVLLASGIYLITYGALGIN
ncbi:hypothetical protein IPM44_03245 [bacterium]|nr:MAG: hypothetical protein IPM44_03245 [bacterium]